MARGRREPKQVQLEADRQDDRRDRSPGGECEGVPEDRRNGLFPTPAGLDQAREEVARPGHQEGDDRARHEVRQRDRGNRTLDECGTLQTDGPLSPGLPDRNDTARWQSGGIRAWRRPIVSESILTCRATSGSRESSRGSTNVPTGSSSLGLATV